MTEMDVAKLDKKQLRVEADRLGVKWDKRTDDEASLRKKLKAHISRIEAVEEKDGTVFDVSQRAPVEVVVDPRTKKVSKRPVGCFGWYFAPLYSPQNKEMVKLCTTECPHAKMCEAFTKESAKALRELEAEMAAEKEVEDVSLEDIKLAEKAGQKKSEKKAEATIVKGEKRKNALDEDDSLEVTFDFDWALSVEDADFRKFYKACAKKWSDGATCRVSEVLDILLDKLGLGEEERATALTELLPEFIAEGQFKRV